VSTHDNFMTMLRARFSRRIYALKLKLLPGWARSQLGLSGPHLDPAPPGDPGDKLVKRVLGHSDGSVPAIDDRYAYVREMRRVLEVWANDLVGSIFDIALCAL
jgi:hypothetical protein